MAGPDELPGLVLHVGAATDTGRVRDHNEDSALAEGGIFVVADGMGGHAAGEVASGIAVEAMRELVTHPELTAEDVSRQLVVANQRILDAVEGNPEQRGMGTTATGLALVSAGGSDHWAVFNVGDSRVYRWIDGGLSQVTVDHSEVQELVDAGVITAEEARVHPARNVVTRSLGTDYAYQSDVWVLPPYAGERFIICSDGLTNEVPDERMRDILQACPDPQVAAEELVRAAVEAGGRDNVTVVVVNLDGDVGDDLAETSPRRPGDDTTPRDSFTEEE
ncbi:PP2C family protein-serine/threonine phosphatase [Janibacter sp. G349]|uniref:PP2C family protein-serine/threonine phosphatase n=1 Tax=unclassified Janibacter TaxID=2649294 RepID=UPI0020CC7A75|nr:PP2C family serine/threonine-protein phosphatase [Janibacter sp. CX7]UTT66120.1 protein phosphatase 2C domain-containing protein [Janibacter sp. CX7]